MSIFTKHWLVTAEKVGTDEVVPAQLKFIARDSDAWKAWDKVGMFLRKKSKEDNVEWRVVNMVRV